MPGRGGAAGNALYVPVVVAVGGLARKSSRNRIPPVPVVPGWEPEELAEREREERAAGAAQTAAARSAWLFEVC